MADTQLNDNVEMEKIKSDVSNDQDPDESKKENNSKHRPPPVDVTAAAAMQSSGGLKTPPAGTGAATPRTPGGLSGRHDTLRDKERKIGHRRVMEGGQVTYKKITTNQIMGSIQLGIHQAVGALANQPQVDVLIQDFYVVETIAFPPSGSETTPAHPYSEFRFKVYAPTAFRHFRNLFRIVPEDYLVSLCNEDLRELSNPGASGSIFYLTSDDEFIIKTIQHKEAEFLQKLLPGYYMNLNQNPRTLLPKFFGLYTYQCNAKNIRLVTMNNLLPSSVKMHQKYDLKGSTYKRKANKYERNKASPTYKDLDFMEHHPDGILLEADTYKALMNTLERDCRVLASFKIMDYSLLVGIHNLDQAAREKLDKMNGKNSAGGKGGQPPASPHGGEGGGTSSGGEGHTSDEDGGEEEGGPSGLSRTRSINRQRLVAHSTAMESIQADAADPIDEEDHVPPGGIPARNVKGERLLLFLGIIDILQSYRLKKKLEHTIKSMVTDGDTISVHRPNFYSQRFQKFMAETVFKRIPSPLRHSPSRRRGGPGSSSMRGLRPHSSSHHLEPSGLPTSPLAQGATVVQAQQGRQQLSLEAKASTVGTINGEKEDYGKGAGRGEEVLSSPSPPPSSVVTGDQSHKVVTQKTHHVKSHHHHVKSTHHHVTTVAIQEDSSDVVSVSDVQLETRTDSRSTLSVDSGSGGGSVAHLSRGHTWTPPLSVEGSTPTWTEGTPSYTESSSSGDIGCPTTPIRSLNTTIDSSLNETEMSRVRQQRNATTKMTTASNGRKNTDSSEKYRVTLQVHNHNNNLKDKKLNRSLDKA